MKCHRDFIVKNTLGIHVRPSAQLADIAHRYQCESYIVIVNDLSIKGMNITSETTPPIRYNMKLGFDVMTACLIMGSHFRVECEGADAEKAIEAISGIIEGGFGED